MDREALLAAIAGDCAGSLDRKGSKIKAPVVLVAARTGLAAIRVSDPRPLAANALSRGLAETRGKPHEVNLIVGRTCDDPRRRRDRWWTGIEVRRIRLFRAPGEALREHRVLEDRP